MRYKIRRKWRHFKQRIYQWMMPGDDYRRLFLMSQVGYPLADRPVTKTLSTQVALDEASHDFLATSEGQCKYDVRYGLARQLADQIVDYISYRESKDEENNEWICRADLEIVVNK